MRIAHIAVWTRDIDRLCKFYIDRLTERLREDGYEILGEPRITGDGYYKCVVADPDGDRIEITA